MAVYRQVHTTFWQDADMIEYSPEEKYFYLYLMTNPHTSQCGIYEISLRLMSIELGYPIDTVSILLQKFIDRGKILYSEITKELFLINWLKYNSLKSPKVKQCIIKELETVKCKSFLKMFNTLSIQYGYPIHSLSIDLGEEKEEENNNNNKNNNNNNNKQKTPSNSSVSLVKFMQERGFPYISPIGMEKLEADIEIYSEEEVKKAIEIADENGKRSYSYVKGILERRRAGVKEKANKEAEFEKAKQAFLEDDGI